MREHRGFHNTLGVGCPRQNHTHALDKGHLHLALRPLISLLHCPNVDQVWVRARVHQVRGKGSSAFLVLRDNDATVQAVHFKDKQNANDSKRSGIAVAAGMVSRHDGVQQRVCVKSASVSVRTSFLCQNIVPWTVTDTMLLLLHRQARHRCR